MASQQVTARLAELGGSQGSQSSRSADLHALLEQILAQSDPTSMGRDLTTFVDAILGESLGIVAARSLMTAWIDGLRQIPSTEVRIDVGRHALQALQPRMASFEEQDAALREILADAYQSQEEYSEAARALQGIQLDSSQRQVSDQIKVQTWIRICRLYLEEDDTVSAESYLNRAKQYLYKLDDTELHLVFQLSQARILDANWQFIEASQRYLEVSQAPAIADDERQVALSHAIICAVLAGAGAQRSRLLGRLFNDERAAQLDEYAILEKMFLNHIITPNEVAKFAEKLAPHQLAKTSDGSTAWAKAVIEHNLLSASQLYRNLSISNLGALLGLEPEKAQSYAARMLEQGRLHGYMDQIDEIIYFDGQDRSSSHHKGGQEQRKQALWDRNVQGLVDDVERVSTLLQVAVPSLSQANAVA